MSLVPEKVKSGPRSTVKLCSPEFNEIVLLEVDRKLNADYGIQLQQIFDYDCNLRTNSIDNILKFFDSDIKDNWDKTHITEKCIKCSLNCGKSSEVDYERLYKRDISNKKSLI